MSFSAAELQKRHGLEGAPDPFPTLGGGPTPKSKPATNGSASASTNGSSAPPANVDTSSESAFPSLGASTAPAQSIAQPAASLWAKGPSSIKTSKQKPVASGGLGRSGAPTANSHPFSDTFSMPTADVATGKALAETLKKVQDQTGAIVESATQMKTGLKTFYIKAADQKRLVYARRIIERGLSKPVTVEVEVPITSLGTIIGPKGATLKSITDSTQCKIDVPRRDTLPAFDPKENQDSDDESEEPQVNITVSGPSAACADAKSKILALISNKTSQSSTSIKNIPSSFYPFIAGPKGVRARELEEEIGGGQVKVHVPPPAVWKALEKQGEEEETHERDLSIKIKGDKEKVKAVVSEIQRLFEELSDSMRELKISIPKRQHRFLVGSSADDILDKTSCIVELPQVEDPSDMCVIRGPQSNLIPALTIVMEKANAIAVETVDIVSLHRPNSSDPFSHAKNVLRYLQRSSKLRQIAEGKSVKIFPPFSSAVASTGTVIIEVVGENKEEVSKAKEEVVAVIKSITPSAITSVEIDSMVHSLLIGKKGSKIAQFESAQNVITVFPPQSEDSSEVLLVYTESAPTEKKAREAHHKDALAKATEALKELAKGAADIKSETLDVEKKWHRAIIGPGGTVLNALIGEDQAVIVKVGQNDEETVVVRGPSTEVDRVISQIKQIVEDAKNDDIINGFTADLSVDKKHVAHLVGQGGSTINKLRETLGVKVNFDDAEDKKGKKTVACKIIGRKEAVEEAKKRLIAQIEKLEDETSETINIKRAIQPALIGSSGKYAIRLEEKYGVKLSFPRESKDGAAPANPDEVVIRGGKKGVASAKAELLEAAAFETESRQSLTFTIPTRAVAQVVGKGGQVINGIKDETGAQIDIDKNGEGGKTTITVRGDKKAIAAAKTAILSLTDSIGEETTTSVSIDHKYHRALIGQGGSKLKDLIVSCGGPEESFKQAGLITFPRQGEEDMNSVKLRGEKGLVSKIKAELEKIVSQLKETITVGVVVPKDQHASKIGRGGMALQSLQRESGATIHFPGSRQYGSVGEIENASEVESADKTDIVKVIGTKEAIAKAKESLETFVQRAPRAEGNRGNGNADQVSRSIPIAKKYYHALADQQSLQRQIRSAGGFLNFPQPAPAKPAFKASGNGTGAKSARIDAAEDEVSEQVEGEWEVRENYTDGSDETLDWVVRAKEEEDLDKAAKVLEEALEKVKAATHVGLLTGLPRSAFPRIIGTKGATISRLRSDTGADIQVGKDDDLITITGDESSVNQAKDAVLSIVQRGGGQRY